jgi:hypothetical protein
MRETIIGVDPGLKGALACISDSKVIVNPTPFLKKEKGTMHTLLDIDKLDEWLDRCIRELGMPDAVAVEEVHSMPTDGKKSAFSFGWGTGSLVTYFRTLGFDVKFYRPQDWQKLLLASIKTELKLSHGDLTKREIDKLASITYVKRTHPDVVLRTSTRATTDSDGMADAVCIASYARLKGE